MSIRQPTSENSGAYLLLFLLAAFLLMAFLITLLNPPWNAIESNPLYTLDTEWGKALTDWLTQVHRWIGLVGLFAILYAALITTRNK